MAWVPLILYISLIKIWVVTFLPLALLFFFCLVKFIVIKNYELLLEGGFCMFRLCINIDSGKGFIPTDLLQYELVSLTN